MIENKAIDIPAPFKRSDYKVKPEWIDHNGHMNVTYYLEAFDQNIGDFFRSLGLTKEYRRRESVATYCGDFHIHYIRELFEKLVLRSPVNWWISTKNVFTCVSLCTMLKKVISRRNQKSFIYM